MRFLSLVLVLCLSRSWARDIHVGQDVKTISEAIKLAQPGDTVHLQPIVYRDYVGLYGKQGEPGKPITIDGHGATLEGSEPLDATKWKELSPGLFANDALLPRLDDAVIGRWFFLWNGKMNRMGRTSKGASPPLKKVEELGAGEWTFVKDPSREQPPSKQIYGTFYIKLAAGEKLANANIALPVRSAGVQMSHLNSHLVIRNLTATHPYNDGFNIHGDCRDVVFENIRAIECGDDGISAHESAQYQVKGFVSIGNSTGICDTGTAHTSYDQVFIADCKGFDLFFLDEGRYRLTNAVVFSSSLNPFMVTGKVGAPRCELDIDNVLIRRLASPKAAAVTTTALLRAKRLTLENMSLETRGEAQLEDCMINGMPTSAGSEGADLAELEKLIPESYRQPQKTSS